MRDQQLRALSLEFALKVIVPMGGSLLEEAEKIYQYLKKKGQ